MVNANVTGSIFRLINLKFRRIDSILIKNKSQLTITWSKLRKIYLKQYSKYFK